MAISRTASFGFISAFALACGGDNSANVDGDGTGSASASAGDTSGETTASADTSASASATLTASAGDTTDAADDDTGPKLDVGGFPDIPSVKCGGKGGGGGNLLSYIWIANSAEGTVSKINTQTMVEEGRYRTRPDFNGSPSRTSVSLNGDVAVANRNGGIVKIYGDHNNCDDPSDTSVGANDIKDWPDGCVAWYTPFVYTSQRPIAWAPGEWDEETCRYENEKLWTSGADATMEVLLLDGDTGALEQTIPVPGVAAEFYGIYGGAVDGDGNFWGTMYFTGGMVFVDRETLDLSFYPVVETGAYGVTVDEYGRPWTCAEEVAVFDPSTEMWTSADVPSHGGGCMVDGNGHLWMGAYIDTDDGPGNLLGVNIDTLAVDYTIELPHYVHGVSIDFDGYVWGVTKEMPWAYKVDVDNQTFETFEGLTGPYTYSDMTGWALSNAVGPPRG